MDLFDGHVYAKGSLILNMMQDHLGDAAFWRSVQHYAKVNQYKNVETQDLKKAIEEISGQNLDWFFKQWVYEPGYPEYDVKWSYNQRNRTVQLKIKQTQNTTKTGLFKMPIEVRVDEHLHTVWVDKKEVVYELPVDMRPELVIFNSGLRIPCELTFNKPVNEWILQLEKGPHVLDRIAAIDVLKNKKGRRSVELALLKAASADPFWGVRREAIQGLSKLKPKQYAKELMEISEGQDNRVRRAIWSALKNYKGDKEVSAFLQDVISTDQKYYSISDAFRALVTVDTSAARKRVEALLDTDSHNDVIRRSAISYFGSVVNNNNYERLKELVEYGGTTWDARPEAVNQLGKYAKKRPETLELFVDLLLDKSRDVRTNSVRALGKYGNKKHFGPLDELALSDPIIERHIRAAKKNILHPPKKPKKSGAEKDLEEANKKIEEIKKILK
tara:strand:- start:260 stop:1588 length:1329 start_codon:yes stop_codon:yes gene_type:complete